jgi:hypothetical protein
VVDKNMKKHKKKRVRWRKRRAEEEENTIKDKK